MASDIGSKGKGGAIVNVTHKKKQVFGDTKYPWGLSKQMF